MKSFDFIRFYRGIHIFDDTDTYMDIVHERTSIETLEGGIVGPFTNGYTKNFSSRGEDVDMYFIRLGPILARHKRPTPHIQTEAGGPTTRNRALRSSSGADLSSSGADLRSLSDDDIHGAEMDAIMENAYKRGLEHQAGEMEKLQAEMEKRHAEMEKKHKKQMKDMLVLIKDKNSTNPPPNTPQNPAPNPPPNPSSNSPSNPPPNPSANPPPNPASSSPTNAPPGDKKAQWHDARQRYQYGDLREADHTQFRSTELQNYRDPLGHRHSDPILGQQPYQSPIIHQLQQPSASYAPRRTQPTYIARHTYVSNMIDQSQAALRRRRAQVAAQAESYEQDLELERLKSLIGHHPY